MSKSKSKANTRRTVAPAGAGKGGAKGASAPTGGAAFDADELRKLHADPALVASAGIQCGMSADEIDRRLIAAATARAQS